MARTGTVAEAAGVLHVTPSALTSRIKLLEEDLGIALFDRTGNRLKATDAGLEVIAAAARIDRGISDLTDTLEAMKGLHGGRVRLGAVSTAKYFAAQIIAAFLRQHEGIDLVLVIGNRAEIIKSLHDYEIDMALMGRPPRDFGVESEPFGTHPHVIIAPPDHPMRRRRNIPLAELTSQKFLLREEGSGTRNIFDHLINQPGIRHPKDNLEMGSNETIKQAVMAGLGLSLISAHTIASEVAGRRLAVLKVEGLPIKREWLVVRRSDRDLPAAGTALWAFIVKKGKSFLPS